MPAFAGLPHFRSSACTIPHLKQNRCALSQTVKIHAQTNLPVDTMHNFPAFFCANPPNSITAVFKAVITQHIAIRNLVQKSDSIFVIDYAFNH